MNMRRVVGMCGLFSGGEGFEFCQRLELCEESFWMKVMILSSVPEASLEGELESSLS